MCCHFTNSIFSQFGLISKSFGTVGLTWNYPNSPICGKGWGGNSFSVVRNCRAGTAIYGFFSNKINISTCTEIRCHRVHTHRAVQTPKSVVHNFFGKLPLLMNLKTKLPFKSFLINHMTTNNSDYPPLKCYLNEIYKITRTVLPSKLRPITLLDVLFKEN